jgi:hypothetical protein
MNRIGHELLGNGDMDNYVVKKGNILLLCQKSCTNY